MANQTYNISIKELIVQDVEAALKRIRRANGYDNNVEVVERWEQDGNDKAIVPALFIHSETKQKVDMPGLVTQCIVAITIDAWCCHDKTKFKNSSDAYLDTIANDIDKAIMADYQRGGYAERTEMSGPAELFHHNEGAATCGVICKYDVHFKHLTGDSKTQF